MKITPPKVIYGAFLSLFLLSPIVQAKSQDLPNREEVCKQTQQEVQELQNEKSKIMNERKRLNEDYAKAQQKMAALQESHRPLVGCSQNNTSNTSQCQKILDGMRASGNKMNEIQKQLSDLGRQKLAVENKLFEPTFRLDTYQCR